MKFTVDLILGIGQLWYNEIIFKIIKLKTIRFKVVLNGEFKDSLEDCYFWIFCSQQKTHYIAEVYPKILTLVKFARKLAT